MKQMTLKSFEWPLVWWTFFLLLSGPLSLAMPLAIPFILLTIATFIHIFA